MPKKEPWLRRYGKKVSEGMVKGSKGSNWASQAKQIQDMELARDKPEKAINLPAKKPSGGPKKKKR